MKKNKSSKNKRPVVITITTCLIILYAFINILTNYITAFYVYTGGGLLNLSFDGFNSVTYTIFFITCIPNILLMIAGLLIWRGSKVSFFVIIFLLIFSFYAALSGGAYLTNNVHELFTKDLLYLTAPPPPDMKWYLRMDFNGYSYLDNVMAYRIMILKSFIKALVEIIGFFFLLFVFLDYKSVRKKLSR